MATQLTLEVAEPGVPQYSQQLLFTTSIALTTLGVDRPAIDRRRVVAEVSELLPDNQSQELQAQWTLDPERPDHVFLAWLASPTHASPRRFMLSVNERSDQPRLVSSLLQVVPEVHDTLAVKRGGQTVFGYCYSANYPKPFFHPVVGPAGDSLTRLGHPRDFSGGHDHHRSLWVEHMDVNGVSFETEHMRYFQEPDSGIIGVGRQLHRGFLQQEDGPLFASLGMLVDWVSQTGETLLSEERRVRIYGLAGGEQIIDLALTFSPQVESVTFGKTNFGVLAVRFAAPLEVIRGNGRIQNSHGHINEAALHLQRAQWCDYAGPLLGDQINGLAIFDHPQNVHFPAPWHVRDDGWLCIAPFYQGAVTVMQGEQLTLRYRIYLHEGDELERLVARYQEFAEPSQVIIVVNG
jgi:hypothetical protein